MLGLLLRRRAIFLRVNGLQRGRHFFHFAGRHSGPHVAIKMHRALAATAFPDKTSRDSTPVPGTCRKQTAARLSARALQVPQKRCPTSLVLLRYFRQPNTSRNPSLLRQSPPVATRCALRRPNCASTTTLRETSTDGSPRSSISCAGPSATSARRRARSPGRVLTSDSYTSHHSFLPQANSMWELLGKNCRWT